MPQNLLNNIIDRCKLYKLVEMKLIKEKLLQSKSILFAKVYSFGGGVLSKFGTSSRTLWNGCLSIQ